MTTEMTRREAVERAAWLLGVPESSITCMALTARAADFAMPELKIRNL